MAGMASNEKRTESRSAPTQAWLQTSQLGDRPVFYTWKERNALILESTFRARDNVIHTSRCVCVEDGGGEAFSSMGWSSCVRMRPADRPRHAHRVITVAISLLCAIACCQIVAIVFSQSWLTLPVSSSSNALTHVPPWSNWIPHSVVAGNFFAFPSFSCVLSLSRSVCAGVIKRPCNVADTQGCHYVALSVRQRRWQSFSSLSLSGTKLRKCLQVFTE